MRNKEKGINIGVKIKKTLASMVLLFIFALPGCILDFTYQGILKCKVCIAYLNFVKSFFKYFGMTHAELWEVIFSNIGVLITLVSIFFTFAIEISERSEKKIFGISRKELMEKGSDKWHDIVSGMAAMLPVFMLVYVVLGLCAGSYLLLFFSYVFLLIIYKKHRSSYDDEIMRKNLCRKLLEPFQGVTFVEDVKGRRDYHNLLMDIYDFTKKEGDWIHLQELFFDFLGMLRKFNDDICFAVEYYFIMIAFGRDKQVHEFDVFVIIIRYMESIKYDKENFDYADRKDLVLLWGMLVASIPYAEEEELIRFFRIFSDFSNRSRYKIRHAGTEISDLICGRECSMVLVLLEEWLVAHNSEERELAVLVKKIYERGRNAFKVNDVLNQWDVMVLYEKIRNGFWNINDALDRGTNENWVRPRVSRVIGLIEIV